MKPLSAGMSAHLSVIVTPEMTVRFGELGPVHPVYATYSLAKHMEEVSRKLLLPCLEDGEEGIGHLVETRHLSSALVGMRVTVSSSYDPQRSDGRRVAARCEARSELGDVIGQGRTEQFVLSREDIEARFAALEARWRTPHEVSRG